MILSQCTGCSLIVDASPSCSGRALSGPQLRRRVPFVRHCRSVSFVGTAEYRRCRRYSVVRSVKKDGEGRGDPPASSAVTRLDSLIAGTRGDGEDEMLQSLLVAEPPMFKVLLVLASGGIVTLGALGLCALVHVDPAGGASLSTSSISAGLLGAAAAIPLVLLKAATWKAGRFIPALADVQKDMLESWGAIMYNLSAAQVAVVILAETVPNLVMLLPAAQGALTVSFNVYIGFLNEMGLQLSDSAAPALALVTTAALCAGIRFYEAAPDSEQMTAVMNAVDNADRYYRLIGTSKDGVSPQEQAEAFIKEARGWIITKATGQRYVGVSTFLEVVFLGLLFHATGDFAAPMVAGVLTSAVDFACMARRVQQNR